MLTKSINSITLQNIEQLIENSIPEGKKIEYKEFLPNKTGDSKKEFLADISSFANTDGGYIIFGLKEENGIPINIVGLSISNINAIILQYENLIQDGISPRIKVECNSKILILFKIFKSWNKPHRVDYRGHDKFYARNSAGKYSLDVEELRITFNSTYEIIEKVKNFVFFRNIDILSNDSFLPLTDNV